jgi:hypothetical protein
VRIVLLVAVAALALAAEAAANGDPASQALPVQDVYVSPAVPEPARAELEEAVERAHDRGNPVKVAVLTNAFELGNLRALYLQPQRYAFHLGTELKFFAGFKGTVLVAMPSGFGTYGPEAGRIRKPATPANTIDGLASSAVAAIEPLGRSSSGGGGSGVGAGVIAAIVGGVLGGVGVAAVAGLLFVRARR